MQKFTLTTKSKYQKVWSGVNGIIDAADAQRPYITSVLPLELTSIILGYSKYFGFTRKNISNIRLIGDGSLRMSDISNLLDIKSAEALSNTKTKTCLNVMIIALFLISNTRTNERIVVGSGDDGSIAFWELKYMIYQSFCIEKNAKYVIIPLLALFDCVRDVLSSLYL